MNFRLFYQGPLKANGTPPEKHQLRRSFHRQLRTLWDQPPLNEIAKRLNMDPSKGKALGVHRGNYLCVPLVCEALELIAALDIIMPPGRVITQAGDIDNRLKTLLDSLQVPKPDQVGASDVPSPDENPLYCLVEDDNLFTSLSVTTDRRTDRRSPAPPSAARPGSVPVAQSGNHATT